MENILEVQNLCKQYGKFALKDVTFSLPRGYVMGFIGKNGSGKTTTIRSILNMANLNSGKIKVFGLDSVCDTVRIKQKIGVVFDDIFFASHLNVQQIQAQMQGFYPQWDTREFTRLVETFKLPGLQKVGTYSRGMKMKLMLAVAMAHKAELLILDEPTSGLDPVARDELLDILADYIGDENKSILFSTHITSDLERIADYITVLSNGKIWFSGTRDELMEQFVVIKGADIPADLQEHVIGCRRSAYGFDALFPTAYAAQLPKEMILENAKMDEILIYLSREEENENVLKSC